MGRGEKGRKVEEVVKEEKMVEVFEEYEGWKEIVGMSRVGDLNVGWKEGDGREVIKVWEGLEEKKIGEIGDEIREGKEEGKGVKVVVMWGGWWCGKRSLRKGVSMEVMSKGVKG